MRQAANRPAASAPRGRRRITAAVDLTFAAPRSSPEHGQHKPDLPEPALLATSLTRMESHACCSLLPRPPRQHLAHGQVRPHASGGGQPGRRHVPRQPASRRAGCPAKRTGGNQRLRSRVRQRLGSLGKQLVHPGSPAKWTLTASWRMTGYPHWPAARGKRVPASRTSRRRGTGEVGTSTPAESLASAPQRHAAHRCAAARRTRVAVGDSPS
jgi:hypothetical protein